MSYYTHLDDFTLDGWTFRASCVHDADHAPPWIEHDGHGPVRTLRDRNEKRPGEIIIGGSRFNWYAYDVAEAQREAFAHGWGISEKEMDRLRAKHGRMPTRREIAAAAVTLAADYLAAWLDDRWMFTVLRVVLLDTDGTETQFDAYLGGVEYWTDRPDDYWRELARDLAAECLGEFEAYARRIMPADAEAHV